MASKKNVIEFEGIEFKCFSLIEYSSLIELLKLLAKKYKSVDDKISILDQRMIEKDKRISELEIMLKGVSQSTDNKFPSVIDKELGKPKEKEKEKIKAKGTLKYMEIQNVTEEKDFENENNKLGDRNEENQNQNLNKETDSNLNISQSDSQLKEKNEENINDKKEENIDNNQTKEEQEHEPENITENNQIIPNQIPTMNVGLNNNGFNSDFQRNSIFSPDVHDLIEKNSGEKNKELFNKILKRLKAHDKQINDLLLRNNEFIVINKNIKVNKNEVEELEKQIKNLKNNISDINRKMQGYNEDLDKIKVKVTDFDVYDLFKGGEGDVDLDAAKILIKTLENKVMKKFEIYDERNKVNDKNLFKMHEDVTNALAIVDGMKSKTDKNAENLEELNQNYQKKMSELDNTVEELQRQLEVISSKLSSKPDLTHFKKDFEKKLKDLEEKLNSKLDLFLNNSQPTNNDTNDNSSVSKNEILSLIKELRKRLGDLEKFSATNFEKIHADDIKKRLTKLESEMNKRAGKYELQELNEKFRSLEEFTKDLNFKEDGLQQFTEKVRLDLAQIIKKIEFLSGEYSKLAFNKSGENDEGLNNVDMSEFLDLKTYNDNKKDINNKFEKVRLGFEDLSREIDEILSKLAHTPTDKDFSEFQNILKNMIDELKISSNKRYADKIETSKSIKFIETQIKALHDAYLRKNEAGDNWLLAKKPINNYVCASCEANIKGELDKRTEFVPWNRYPQRDDKAYRIGHGFSRMLQMVNEDIIKNAGEKGGYSSDEDNKKINMKTNNNISQIGDKNLQVNTSVKLPKVSRKKPLLGGTAVTEPNTNTNAISPYDDVDADNNDTNKVQIMRVVRKNKIQSESSNRDNSAFAMKSKNNDISNNINNNENEN
jgi:DNA repair exonuclease SbcCD ATPase subunit